MYRLPQFPRTFVTIATRAALVAFAAFAFSSAASAQICHLFEFPLSGAEEVPPVDTEATGTGIVRVYTVTNVFEFQISYANLSSEENAAHLHGPAPIGKEASPLFNLPAGNPKIGEVTYNQVNETDILGGLTYVNIHSTLNGAGEIRGQLDNPTSCEVFVDGFENLDPFGPWMCEGDGCPI